MNGRTAVALHGDGLFLAFDQKRNMTNQTTQAARAALQVLEGIWTENPAAIDHHMPAGWGMNKLREQLRAALEVDCGAEILPGATAEEIASVMMQELVGDYNTPDQVPEWEWVQANASFEHRRNGSDGIWEFILNLSVPLADAPEKLRPVIWEKRADGCAYLIIHQGT